MVPRRRGAPWHQVLSTLKKFEKKKSRYYGRPAITSTGPNYKPHHTGQPLIVVFSLVGPLFGNVLIHIVNSLGKNLLGTCHVMTII